MWSVKKVNNDSRIVQQQIGRKLRSDSEVSCRCHLDIPVVIKVPPKLNDGTPFPTTYWLTCPMYNKKIGSLESQGLIKELDKELENNPDLKEKWQSRQKSYQAEREELANDNSRPQARGGVGGATESIKCLHSHTADELSTGKNIIGKIVVESIGSFNCEEACINPKTFKKNKDWKVIW